jgi:zinc transport system substrate-binding protein
MILMLRSALAVNVVAAVASLGACGGDDSAPDSGRLQVVASFYPLEWVAQQVGGPTVEVTNLTRTGVEPHDVELSPGQVAAIGEADIVVMMGGGFQPAVESAASGSPRPVVILDQLTVDATDDPHVWLDPSLFSAIVDEVEAALIDVVPDRADSVRANADRLRAELTDLDASYRDGLEDCARRELFTAHEAFGWLAERYDLEQHGVAGISPDAEPSPQRLAELAELVQETGATTIFAETLVSPEIAETLAAEAGGLHVATLNPIEGLTEEQADAGSDYLELMRANLETLR